MMDGIEMELKFGPYEAGSKKIGVGGMEWAVKAKTATPHELKSVADHLVELQQGMAGMQPQMRRASSVGE